MTVKKAVNYCDFCGKTQYEVLQLIAGPRTFICDECVDLCKDICDEYKMRKKIEREQKEKGLVLVRATQFANMRAMTSLEKFNRFHEINE